MGAYDTYEQRQAARDKGFYIDNSGVYAPGSGERVSDTWSGKNASRNEAPSPTRLPIINGAPVSPSNGLTGEQTPYIMYRSDPLYAGLFGPGTPGYSSTSRQANAMPAGPQPGQPGLMDFWNRQGVKLQPNGAPMPAPEPTVAPPANGTGVTAPGTNPSVQSSGTPKPQVPDYAAEFGTANPQGGFGPYQTNAAPALTIETRYEENGKIIEKSIDQFGNPYYKEVGMAPALPNQAAAAPAKPAPVPGEPTQPATFGGEQDLVPIAMPDGKVVQVPREFYNDYLEAGRAQAEAAKQAIQFNQGIEQGKLDVSKMVEANNAAYQKALIAGQNADRAQQAGIEAMRVELQKQSLELQKQLQLQNAEYQKQQLELERGRTAQTISLEREKLAEQRRSQRGRRRLPQVRFK